MKIARVDSMRQLDQLKIENQKLNEVIKRQEAVNAGLREAKEAKAAILEQVSGQLTEAQK